MRKNDFAQQIQEMQQRVTQLQQRAGKSPSQQPELEVLAATFEELSATLEELRVAQEELRQQNEALQWQNQELSVANQALAAERQRYEELFEFAPDGYLVTDTNGVIQEANRAAATQLNVSQRFLLNKPLIIYVAEAEQQAFCTKLNYVCQTDAVQEWEMSIQPRGRTPITAAVKVAATRDREGQPVGLRWLVRDISDRQRSEKALRQQLAAIEAATDGIAISSQDGKYIYLNSSHIKLFGYESADELLGKSWRELYSPEEVARFECDIVPILWQNREWRGEATGKKQDGTTFPVEVSLTSIDGVGIICVCRDITERKLAEEEVCKALEKEKELGELKSRFVSMASHEFRTPLATILFSSGLLEDYGSKWPEEKKLTHLHRIQSAVQRMKSILDDLLLIGKVDAGKMEFKPAPLDLEQFCRELIAEMQLIAAPSQTLTFVTQGKCCQTCMDEKLLHHILTNLLSNATKYSPEGRTVFCELSCDRDRATFRIQDQGIGIPQQDLPRLFETFHRAANVGTISGTGLGLAIVKKFVDLHQGEIAVESQVGVGTTFTVTLPLRSTSSDE